MFVWDSINSLFFWVIILYAITISKKSYPSEIVIGQPWGGLGDNLLPSGLKDRYQSYTQSDLSLLRQAGYVETFFSIEEGVNAYLDKIETKIE